MPRRGRGALSRTVRVGSKDFEDAITAAVEEMCQDAERESIDRSIDAGDRAVKLLKERSKRTQGGGKHYADGFVTDLRVSRYGHSVTVHNKNKPTLTHLLEFGHDIVVHGVRVGRVEGDGIMGKVAEEVSGVLFEGYR